MSLDWHPLPPPVPLRHWGPLEPTSIIDINYLNHRRHVHRHFAVSDFRYCPLNKIPNARSVCTRIFSLSFKKFDLCTGTGTNLIPMSISFNKLISLPIKMCACKYSYYRSAPAPVPVPLPIPTPVPIHNNKFISASIICIHTY
jgi:hypothetical protein